LRLECIDLFQLHRVDPSVPIEESVDALAQLQREGKVRHIGLSEVNVDQLERARAIAPIATVQNRYNVTDREHDVVLNYCETHSMGFIPWYPLGSGSLCAKDGPLASAASRLGATPSQVALAWLLARSPVVLPIPGTASAAHLEENVAAQKLTLTKDDLADLDSLAAV
jgi:aryl-alcohol dehydrogenase-like predicted oxidoreductase